MESKDISKICYTIITVVAIIGLSSLSPTPEEIEAEAKLVEAEAVKIEAEGEAELELQAKNALEIRLLVQRGVPPFVARCAVIGYPWYNATNCSQASEKYHKSIKEDD